MKQRPGTSPETTWHFQAGSMVGVLNLLFLPVPGTSQGATWYSGTRGYYYGPGPPAKEVGL